MAWRTLTFCSAGLPLPKCRPVLVCAPGLSSIAFQVLETCGYTAMSLSPLSDLNCSAVRLSSIESSWPLRRAATAASLLE